MPSLQMVGDFKPHYSYVIKPLVPTRLQETVL